MKSEGVGLKDRMCKKGGTGLRSRERRQGKDLGSSTDQRGSRLANRTIFEGKVKDPQNPEKHPGPGVAERFNWPRETGKTAKTSVSYLGQKKDGTLSDSPDRSQRISQNRSIADLSKCPPVRRWIPEKQVQILTS